MCFTVKTDKDVCANEFRPTPKDIDGTEDSGKTPKRSKHSRSKKTKILYFFLKRAMHLVSLDVRDVSIITDDATPVLYLEVLTASPSFSKQEMELKGLIFMAQKTPIAEGEKGQPCMLKLDHLSFQHVGTTHAPQHPTLELGHLTLTQTPSSIAKAQELIKMLSNNKRKQKRVESAASQNFLYQIRDAINFFHALTVRWSALEVQTVIADAESGDEISGKVVLDGVEIKCSVTRNAQHAGQSLEVTWKNINFLGHLVQLVQPNDSTHEAAASGHPFVDARLDCGTVTVATASTSDFKLDCELRLSRVMAKLRHRQMVAIISKGLFSLAKPHLIEYRPAHGDKCRTKNRNDIFQSVKCTLEQQSFVGLFNDVMDPIVQAEVDSFAFDRINDQDVFKRIRLVSQGIVLHCGPQNYRESSSSSILSLDSLCMTQQTEFYEDANLMPSPRKSLDAKVGSVVCVVEGHLLMSSLPDIFNTVSQVTSLGKHVSMLRKQRTTVLRSDVPSTSISVLLDSFKLSVGNGVGAHTPGSLCLEASSTRLSATKDRESHATITKMLLQVTSTDIHFYPGAGAEHDGTEGAVKVKVVGLTNLSIGLEGQKRRVSLERCECVWDADALLCGLYVLQHVSLQHSTWRRVNGEDSALGPLQGQSMKPQRSNPEQDETRTKESKTDYKTDYMLQVGTVQASLPLTGEMEVGLNLTGGEAGFQVKGSLLTNSFFVTGSTTLSLKDKSFVEWKALKARYLNDAPSTISIVTTALVVSVPYDRQPGPTLRYLNTYIKAFVSYVLSSMPFKRSPSPKSKKAEGNMGNSPPPAPQLPYIHFELDGGLTFRFEHHPLEAWLAKKGPTLQNNALQSHLSGDVSGFKPLDTSRKIGPATVPCSDLLCVRVKSLRFSMILTEYRGDTAKQSIIDFISQVDPPTKGVALDTVRQLVLEETLIQGAEVWVAGAIEPFVAAETLTIRGPVALARQKTSPPVTFQRTIPLSLRSSSKMVDVEATLPACRPPLKLYTNVVVSVRGGLTVSFNPGFSAVFAIMGLAGKRLVSGGLGNLLDSNGEPIRRPPPVPWWDDIRYVWRGGARLEIEQFKFVLAAERTLSFCQEDLTPRLVVEAGKVEGRLGRIHSNTSSVEASNLYDQYDHAFSMQSLVCNLYPRSLDVDFNSASGGNPSSLLVKVPLLDAPFLGVAANIHWVGPSGKDGSAHHIFPSPPSSLHVSQTPPEPKQGPIFVAEAFKAEAFDVDLDISFNTPQHEARPLGTVDRVKGYFGEAQVGFFRRLISILKAPPPTFKAIAKKGTFFDRKQRGGPPKRPLPRLLRNMGLSISSRACNIERWSVRHQQEQEEHLDDGLDGRLMLSSSSVSFRASWLCNQPDTVACDLLVQLEDVNLSYTNRKSLTPLGVLPTHLPPQTDAVVVDHESLVTSVGWVTIVRARGVGQDSPRPSSALLKISIGNCRLVLGDGEDLHSEDLAEAVKSIVRIVGAFTLRNSSSRTDGRETSCDKVRKEQSESKSKRKSSLGENEMEDTTGDLLSLLLRQREDSRLMDDDTNKTLEDSMKTEEELQVEHGKQNTVDIKYEIDVVDVQAMGAWEGGLASAEGQARLVLVADVGRVIGYSNGSTVATTSIQAFLGLGEGVFVKDNQAEGPWLRMDMHRGYVAADGGSKVRRVVRCTNIEVRHEKKLGALEVKTGEISASLNGQEFQAVISAASGLASVGRLIASGVKKSIQRSFSRVVSRVELTVLAQERCFRWKDLLMLVSAGNDVHAQNLIAQAEEAEGIAVRAYKSMKESLQSIEEKETRKRGEDPRNSNNSGKLSRMVVHIGAVKWNLLAGEGSSGGSDGASIVRLLAWGVHFERQVVKTPKGSGSMRVIVHGLEIIDAAGRLPIGTPILAHWNPDERYEQDPMLRVVASMGESNDSEVVVFQHLNATLRPLEVHLTESVASACRDYFVQKLDGKEAALRQKFLRSVGKTHRAGGTPGRRASLNQNQNRKGELWCRFTYFKLDRAHLRITYLGRPVSIRDRILVINSYTCEDLEGRWNHILSTIRNKAVLSAVWSGLGLQGRKVRELLEGAGMGGGEGGVGMLVEKQMQLQLQLQEDVERDVVLDSREGRKEGGDGPQMETEAKKKTEIASEMDDDNDPNNLAKKRALIGGRMLSVLGTPPSVASSSEPKGWMRTIAHAAKDLGLKSPSRRR